MRATRPAHLPHPAQVRSIAFLMLGGIGDTLVATPTIHAFRQCYPQARTTIILRGEGRELAAGNPDIGEILVFRSGSRWRKLQFLLQLALRRWDLWVDLHPPTFNTVTTNAAVFRRNALMMRMAWTRHRIGFAERATGPYLTHAVPVPSPEILRRENIVDTTLRLVGGAGAFPTRKHLPPVTPAASRRADTRLPRSVGARRRHIGLFFGSRQPSDVWPFGQLMEFCRLLVRDYPLHRFLVLGGPLEHAKAEQLLQVLGSDAAAFVNLAGAASLTDTAALLAGCDALVTTDSGPMHMADALGIPLVSLFSSKNYPAIWAPVSDRHVQLNRPVPCGPCFSNVCLHDNLCLALIRPEDVLQALGAVLAQPALS